MTASHTMTVTEITGPFRGSTALAEGLLTRRQLRAGLARRLFRDVYLPIGIPVTHRLRCQAAALIVPPEAVLTGWSAATLRGVELAATDDPVEVLVPWGHWFVAPRGMHVRYVPVRRDEFEYLHEVPVATLQRVAFDLLVNTRLRRGLGQAVGYLDALLRHGHVDLDLLQCQLAERRDHGVVRAREAAALTDPRAESVPESVLRVLLVRHGLGVVPQFVVRHRGRFVARLDLAIPGSMVAVEYDGAWHAEPGQVERDRIRRAQLRALGWQLIVVDRDRLRDDPAGIVRSVRRAITGAIAA